MDGPTGGRDASRAHRRVAEHTRRDQELLDRVVRGLFEVGLSLQAAVHLPGEVARDRITEALGELDDTIHEIRTYAFSADEQGMPPAAASPNGAT